MFKKIKAKMKENEGHDIKTPDGRTIRIKTECLCGRRTSLAHHEAISVGNAEPHPYVGPR